MKKIIVTACTSIVCGLLLGSVAHATNGTFSSIDSYKVWDTHIDIYFANDQTHACSGGHGTRFVLDPSDEAKRDALLAAFLSGREVQLSYACGSDNYPWINGVRLR